MADFTLVIANKAYSSWSLRGWLAVKITGAEFTEIIIPLREPDTHTEVLKYSPSAKLPVLIHQDVSVWESLAIIEYLAELFPEAGLWPQDSAARAHARSIAAEMHGGFIPLRRALPMNVRQTVSQVHLDDAVQADVNRIQAIWREAKRRCDGACGEGPFLLGRFSAVDAMFAPVATRFRTYRIALEEHAEAYATAIMDHPFVKEWIQSAKDEPWFIPEFEQISGDTR